MTLFGYTGDNLTLYNIDWDADDSAPLAGNLPASSPLSPVFPCLWSPRHMLARRLFGGAYVYRRVVCNAGNLAYRSGPGATVTILLQPYIVQEVVGEQRPYSD